ncbi:hypothetical protein GCM10023238_18870 [Streptomyces heliomycini]
MFAAVAAARRPDQLPDLPWGLAAVVLVSAATYLAGKYAEGSAAGHSVGGAGAGGR